MTLRKLCASLLVSAFILAPTSLVAQEKSKKKKGLPRGTPVLWRAPANVESRDLFHGPGGKAMKPNLRRVTFLKQEEGGYSPKFRVRDASGRVWVAKMGKEAQSETAAVRLIWAAGYETEVNYLAPCVQIKGAPAPSKKVERCRGGGFANVRFEARPTTVKRLDEWKWEKNPFAGTRELRGLKVLMALINNWDIKDSNNVILHAPGARKGRGELRYVISDLGATFGKTGSLPLFWRITRSRNDPEGYEEAKFIDEVEDDGRVDFHYNRKKRGIFDDVKVEDARWIGEILSRLSDGQLMEAFRAANYTPEERRTLKEAVRGRIDELVSLRRKGEEAGSNSPRK